MKKPVAILLAILVFVAVLQGASGKNVAGAEQTGWRELSTGSSGLAEGVAVSAVAIDPRNPSVVYAGTDFSGVYKSTDAGASWKAVSSTVSEMTNVLSLAIDPQNTNTLYAGLFNFGRPRIYKSDDAGLTWKVLNGAPQYPIYTLAIDPNHTSVIYAYARSSGCHRSDDGGITWKRLNLGTVDFQGCCLAIDPKNSDVIYIVQYGSIYKSEDRGEHWIGLQVGTNTALYVAIDPDNTSVLYASTDGLGIFKSTDAGKTWTQTSLSIANADSIAVGPANSAMMFAIDNSRGVCGSIEETSDAWRDWRYTDLTGLPTQMGRDSLTGKGPLRALAVGSDGALFLGTIKGLFKYAAPVTAALGLTTTIVPATGGSVAKSPDQAAYLPGTVVTLTAVAAQGWQFVAWTGATANATDSLKATIMMDTDKAVTATFTPIVNPLPAASLLSPANGATVAPGTVTFAWSPVNTATKYEFVLYNHLGGIAADSTMTRTSAMYDLGLIETVTWKVRAGNDKDGWSGWSPVWSLVIQTPPVRAASIIVLAIGSATATVNGVSVALDAAPEIGNGRTFVPLRFIAETFGADVQWLATTRGIMITLGSLTVSLQIGSTSSVVGGNITTMEAAPYIRNSRTMVPLRVISEAFGGSVVWDPASRTVTISYTAS